MTAPEAENERERRRSEHLITGHVNMAGALARRFAGRGESPEDLKQVALTALVKAAGRFDETRGVAFATFATVSVVGELKRHFRDSAWAVRAPRPLHDLYVQLGEANETLGHRLNRPPTIPEIGAYLGQSNESIHEAMEAGNGYRPTSLDAPTSDEGRAMVDELPAGGDPYEDRLNHMRLLQLLPTLSRDEQLVVRRYFFDERTQLVIGDELGVSQMQVSRLLARSLRRLRSNFDTGR
jgi:RNA polymerase sigma-B factor